MLAGVGIHGEDGMCELPPKSLDGWELRKGSSCLVTTRGHRYSATTLSLPIQAQGILGEAM